MAACIVVFPRHVDSSRPAYIATGNEFDVRVVRGFSKSRSEHTLCSYNGERIGMYIADEGINVGSESADLWSGCEPTTGLVQRLRLSNLTRLIAVLY